MEVVIVCSSVIFNARQKKLFKPHTSFKAFDQSVLISRG